MRLYNVTVIRKQVWEYKNVEAKSEEEAKYCVEQMALRETPCDDYLHETIVEEVEEE